MKQKAYLCLSNGESLPGFRMGSDAESDGELVFSTSLVGYSEAITDPSYCGQILVFSYPLIGNYGVPKKEFNTLGYESSKAHVAGLVIAVYSDHFSHWKAEYNLDSWLKAEGVPGIHGIDTRYLTQMIRDSREPLFGKISNKPQNKLTKSDFFDSYHTNLVKRVSNTKVETFGEKGGKHIAVVDCGVKWNIIRSLTSYGCYVSVVPWDHDLSKIECDGVVLSNGPGNPATVEGLVQQVKSFMERNIPLLGICLGHQVLSLAAGASTERMPYGHRSHNQPVVDLETEKAYVTSQNHGYVVHKKDFPSDWKIWFENANDQTVEGIKHLSLPFFSVQFHPEASGGPRDTKFVFETFLAAVDRYLAEAGRHAT